MHTIEAAWFGFDIGRVVTEFLQGKKPQDIGDDYLDVKPYPHAFEAIELIIAQTAASRTYAVSYCWPTVEAMTRRWLVHHRFYDRTGFQPDMLGFTHNYRDKATEAMRLTKGRATDFVDDKLVVLDPMRGIVPNLILFGPQPFDQVVPNDIVHVDDWLELLALYGLSL